MSAEIPQPKGDGMEQTMDLDAEFDGIVDAQLSDIDAIDQSGGAEAEVLPFGIFVKDVAEISDSGGWEALIAGTTYTGYKEEAGELSEGTE